MADHAARTWNDLEEILRKARSVEQIDGEESGKRRGAVRLEHDGVTGHQRSQRVGNRESQRVVPRRNNTDDTLGVVIDGGFGQHRYCAVCSLRFQQLRPLVAVVAGGDSGVYELLVGTGAVLAGLGLQQVQHLVAVGKQQVVEVVQHFAALFRCHAGPLLLRRTGTLEGLVDIGLGTDRNLRQLLAGKWRRDSGGLRLISYRDALKKAGNELVVKRIADGSSVCRGSRCCHGTDTTVARRSEIVNLAKLLKFRKL